jgi:hypothetical protein
MNNGEIWKGVIPTRSMRVIIIVSFISIILFSCEYNGKVKYSQKEYYIEDSFIVKGRFINDKVKDGMFYTYYPTGEISSVSIYENDTLRNDLFFLYFHKNNKIETYKIRDSKFLKNNFQYLFDEHGDTIAYFIRERSLYFYKNNIFKSIEIGNKFLLTYDSLKQIEKFKGSLDVLSREDSLVIVNDHPDFVKDIATFLH